MLYITSQNARCHRTGMAGVVQVECCVHLLSLQADSDPATEAASARPDDLDCCREQNLKCGYTTPGQGRTPLPMCHGKLHLDHRLGVRIQVQMTQAQWLRTWPQHEPELSSASLSLRFCTITYLYYWVSKLWVLAKFSNYPSLSVHFSSSCYLLPWLWLLKLWRTPSVLGNFCNASVEHSHGDCGG